MDKNEFLIPDIHIGNTIVSWLKSNNYTQIQLSEKLGIPQPSLSRILKQKTMDTDKLYSISSILNHNFFYNYCLHHYNRVVSPELGPSDLNIGNIIHNKLREMHISHKELADKLGLDPSTVSKILKKEWIDTGKLVMISEAISYNFFEEYCMPINVNRSRIYYHRSIEELLPTNQEEYVKVEISLSTKTMEKIKYIAALTDWTTDELVYLGLNLFLKRYEESQMGKDKSETET